MHRKTYFKIGFVVILVAMLAVPSLTGSVVAEEKRSINVDLNAYAIRCLYPDMQWHLEGVSMKLKTVRDGSSHEFYTDGGIVAEPENQDPPHLIFSWYYPEWAPFTWSGSFPVRVTNWKHYNFGGICNYIEVDFDYYVDDEYQGHFNKVFYD